MTFSFKLTNPIPQDGVISLIWPSQVGFQRSSADGITRVSIYGVEQSGFTTTVVRASNTIQINGLFSSSGIDVQSGDIVIEIDELINPVTQIQSSSFTIMTMDGSKNQIDKTSSGLTVSSTLPGIITLNSIIPSSYASGAQVTVQIFEGTYINPTGAFLRVYWPEEITYLPSEPLVCTMFFGFTSNSPPCTVNTSEKYIELSYYRSVDHLYTIGTFQNPTGVMETSTWKLEVLDSTGLIILHKLTGITYSTEPGAITVTTASRSTDSLTIGARSDYMLTFQTSTSISSNDLIKFVFPYDQMRYDSTTACFSGSTNLGCTFTDVNSTHFETRIVQWCSSGNECMGGSSINIEFQSAINPLVVIDPVTSSIEIMTLNAAASGTPIIDAVTTGIQFSPAVTTAVLTDIHVDKDSTSNEVSQKTSYNITFTSITEVPENGQVKLQFPDGAVYKASGTNVVCTDISAGSTSMTCTSIVDSENMLSQLLIINACPSGCPSGTTFTYEITEVYNAGSSGAIDTNFRVTTQTSDGYMIDSGSAASTTGFQILAGKFTSIEVIAPSGYIIVGEYTRYALSIELSSTIPSVGGKFVITFPSQIETKTGTCKSVVGSALHNCVVNTSDNTVTVTFNSDATAGSTLLVTIHNSIRNPQTGAKSDYLIFESTSTQNGETSILERSTDLISIHPNEYADLVNTKATRVSSPHINEVVNVDLFATSANPIPVQSTITVGYPLDHVVLNVANINDLEFYALDSSGNAGIKLTPIASVQNGTHIVKKFFEWCSGDIDSCPEGAENIRIRAVGFRNPPTTSEPARSFLFYVDTLFGSKIDFEDRGLYPTPSIQIGSMPNVTITSNSTSFNSLTTYSVWYTTVTELTQPSIYASMTLPPGLLYEGDDVSCSFGGVEIIPSTN